MSAGVSTLFRLTSSHFPRNRNKFRGNFVSLQPKPIVRSNMSYSQMAQLELMNAAANVTSQDDLDALRLTLSLFFAERAQRAIDKMWDEGTFDQKKLDELRGQHLRTPYKTL